MELMQPSFAAWAPALPREKRVAVLMSGGVDSSTAAHLLLKQGWDIVGVTMKIPMSCNPGTRGCCGADAALVCRDLGIPHYFIDVAEEFRRLIIERFRSAYAQGCTPNPCADCNTFLKYSLVMDYVQERLDVDFIASGHYVQIGAVNGKFALKRAQDETKDQSYFLYGIEPDRLQNLIFPLGSLRKNGVRQIAKKAALPVWEKSESMELCFCGDDYRDGLATGQTPGPIKNLAGDSLGQHKGIENYTVGQRKGLGIATGEPVYVVAIEADSNTVYVGSREEAEVKTVAARLETVYVEEFLKTGENLYVKIRSYGDPSPSRIQSLDADSVTIVFAEPLLAPAPGQKLVLYDEDDFLVAGGTILSAR